MKLRYMLSLFALGAVASFSFFNYTDVRAQLGAGSGTINQLTQWLVSGGYVKTASSTAKLWIPGLASSDDCLVTDATGKVSTAACGTGGGTSEWTDAGTYVYPNEGDYASAPYFVATSTSATSTFTKLEVSTGLTLFGTFADALSDLCVAITDGSGLCDGVDETGTGLATSTAIADTYMIYGTSPTTVGAESTFTYDDATDKLSVGSVQATGQIHLADGGAGTPSLVFTNDSNTGLSLNGANGLGLQANGAYVTWDGNAVFPAADGVRDLGISGTNRWDDIFSKKIFVDNASSTYSSATIFFGNLTGTATLAAALGANGSNCSAGQFPLGVDASGAVETCTDAWTESENTSASYINASALTPYLTLSAFYSTTTSDIGEGTNLYYTDARVNSYVHGSTTIPKTYTANTFTGLQTIGNASTTHLSVSGNSYLGTVQSGTWNGTAIGDTYITKSGDWTGTIDGNNFAGGAIGAGQLIYGGSAGSFSELTLGASSTILTNDGTSPRWLAGSALCVAITGSAGLCDGTDDGGSASPGGSDTYAQYNNGGSFGAMQSSVSGLRWIAGDNSVLVGTTSESAARLEVTNKDSTFSSDQVRITSTSASGGNADIHISSPDADIEFCNETMGANPSDCFEIDSPAGNNQLYFTPRNSTDSSYEFPALTIHRNGATGYGTIGIGTQYDTPDGTMEIVGLTAETNILALTSAHGATGGNVLTVLKTGNIGIGTTTPYAKLSVAGRVVGEYFTATSTTPSVFPFASTTVLSASSALCISTDCRTSWPAGSTNYWTSDATIGTYLNTNSTSSAPVFVATSTVSTSTLPRLAATTAFTLIGDYITNVATWFDTKIEALTAVVLQGTWDFGGATSLEIVNGTGPTVDTLGEIALDTTDDQLLVADSGGTVRVFATDEFRLISTTIASTSLAFASGQTLAALGEKDGIEITQYRCYVVGGTSKAINLTDGTNDTESITCGTAMTSDTDVATNDTFTADELGYLEMGATSGTVNYLHFEAWGRVTRE